MAIYDDLIAGGLLSPSDQREAALMGLFNLGAQIGNRGAARLSPTPPPLDLAGPMAVYQNSLNAALQRGALAKKLRDEKAMRNMFAPQPVNEQMARGIANRAVASMMARPEMDDPGAFGSDYDAYEQGYMDKALPVARQQTTVPSALQPVPAAVRPFISAVAQYDPKSAITMAGNVLAEQYKYRKPNYRNVVVNGQNRVMSETQIAAEQARGSVVEPFTSPSTVVNLGGKLQEKIGVGILESSDKISEAAGTARTTLGTLTEMERLLDSGLNTGFGAEYEVAAARLARRLNLSDINVSQKEGFLALSNELVLPRVKQLGVNPTDKDLDFVVKGNPTLTKTPEGNRFIIGILKLKAQRDIARAEFDQRFFDENADLLTTQPMEYRTKYNRAFREFIRQNPLFKKPVPPANNAATSSLPSVFTEDD